MDQWSGVIANTMSNVPPKNTKINTPPNQLLITHTKDWWTFLSEFILIGGSLCALGFMFKELMNHQTSDTKKQKLMAEDMKQKLIQKINKYGRHINEFETSTYEDQLLSMIVLPEMIDVHFSDIGGLNNIKQDLLETVLVPLIYPQLTRTSKLCAPPLGVLFYGAPGTGKTMMAKAIALETNATFFNVDMSRLMSKWYGDSQKFISALFSLARKMAPSIIWIDEIDALFANRSSNDHHADIYNKALFLSLWDGLSSDIYNMKEKNKNHGCAQVIVLGATNRPQEVDEAFLRRMSRQYEFSMPNMKTRELILKILLNGENVHSNVQLPVIANKTAHYSGSDLKELCKYAATLPLRAFVRKSGSLNVKGNITSMEMNDIMFTEYDNEYNTIPGRNVLQTHGEISVSSVSCSDVFGNILANENFKLRSIEMLDLMTALTHIKSTLKSHNFHQQKYGQKKNFIRNPLFNIFGNSNNAYEYFPSKKQNEDIDNEIINETNDEANSYENEILEVE